MIRAPGSGIVERVESATGSSVERDVDGSSTEYFDLDVRGDRVERLMREIFAVHWERVSVGPLVQGAAWELRFSQPPRVSMLDGYLTVDNGQGHFHLCVNDHRDATPEARAVRRVGRAAFFVARGGGHTPATWGLRLWNGRGEQLITVLFPSAYYDDGFARLAEPDWSRTRLWEELRARFGA